MEKLSVTADSKKNLSRASKRLSSKYMPGLYLRGETYYYRVRVPKKILVRCTMTEIRFSLQTDSLKEAKRRASLAAVFLQAMFQEKGMVHFKDLEEVKAFVEKTSQTLNLPAQKSLVAEPPPMAMNVHFWLTKQGIDYTVEEVAAELFLHLGQDTSLTFDVRKLDALLGKKGKVHLEMDEIAKRFVGYFRWLLNEDARRPHSRSLYEERKLDSPLLVFDTPKKLGLTQGAQFNALWELHEAMINNPPILCVFCEGLLEKFVAEDVFTLTEISHENHLTIMNEYCKVSVEYLKIMQARLDKDFAYEKNFMQMPYTQYPRVKASTIHTHSEPIQVEELVTYNRSKKTDNKEPNLSFFMEDYLETKVKDGKKDVRYIPELQKHLELFVTIIGDKVPSSYARTEFRHYRDCLQKLPPNFSRRKDLKNIPIHKLLEMSHTAVLSDKTVNGYLTDISALFGWLVTEGYLKKNYASGLNIKEKQAEIDARESFSSEDILAIFTSEKLQTFRDSAYPSRYWVPWIGLYTGMRLEEICQLHCVDIRDVDGVWVIDINDRKSADGEKDKKLKSINANRMIPVHTHLMELGLLDYVAEMQKHHTRLFPDLKPSGHRNQYGKMITKWFAPFTRSLGVTGKKSFHSLRHAFSDFYKKQLMHNEIFEQIFGHTHGKLATRRYGERFSPKDCYERLIILLDYGLPRKK